MYSYLEDVSLRILTQVRDSWSNCVWLTKGRKGAKLQVFVREGSETERQELLLASCLLWSCVLTGINMWTQTWPHPRFQCQRQAPAAQSPAASPPRPQRPSSAAPQPPSCSPVVARSFTPASCLGASHSQSPRPRRPGSQPPRSPVAAAGSQSQMATSSKP